MRLRLPMLVLLLAAPLAVAEHIRAQLGQTSKAFPLRASADAAVDAGIPDAGPAAPVFTFLPDAGTGAPAPSNALCQYMSDQTMLAGTYTCRDASGANLGTTMEAVGSPTVSSLPHCPNGTDCTALSRDALNGTSQYYRTAATTHGTGDFTACAIAFWDGLANGAAAAQILIAKYGTNRTWTIERSGGDFLVRGAAVNSGGTQATTTPTAMATLYRPGADELWCMTYVSSSGDVKLYRNAVQEGMTANLTGTLRSESERVTIGARSTAANFYRGRLRLGVYTETLLTTAQMHLILQKAMGAGTLTGSGGEVVTFTRASGSSCARSDGLAITLLPLTTVATPCVRAGGLQIGAQSTNQALRTRSFDDAAWTKSNVTVTANNSSVADPFGSFSADQLASTVNDGYVESTAFSLTGTNISGSVYVRTSAGTQDGIVKVRNTTAGADVCSATFTANATAWQRVSCSSSSATTANNHTLRIYPGPAGSTGTLLAVAAQAEPMPWPTAYIEVDGTAVTRSAATASVPSTSFPQATGTIEATVRPTWSNPGDHSVMECFGGSTGWRWRVTGSTDQLDFRVDNGATTAASSGLTWTGGTAYATAAQWGATQAHIWRDAYSATSLGAHSPGALPANCYLGSTSGGANQFEGVIGPITLRPQ